MAHTFLFESMEARSLLSAVRTVMPIPTVGASSGLHASDTTVTTPYFKTIGTDAQNKTDTSNTNAELDTAVTVTFIRATGHGGIDNTHLSRQAVQITNLNTGQVYNNANGGISGLLQKVSTSGGGDILVLEPKVHWAADTTYKVEINGSFSPSGQLLRDVQGTDFAPYGDNTTTFTTGTYLPTAALSTQKGVAFTQTTQTAAGTRAYTATTIGPDHKLYAATSDGYIYRFTIASDGTLTADGTIAAIRDEPGNSDGRLITGIAFTPGSTAGNMDLWVSNSQYRFGNSPSGSDDVQKYADNFTGAITSLSATATSGNADLSASGVLVEDLIVHIPRSVKDHTNNQIVFSPDGRTAYFGVAAMNAMGDADSTWGNRPENIYSATIMQVRVGGDNGIRAYRNLNNGPVDLMLDPAAGETAENATGTTAATRHYNIYKGGNHPGDPNPLRIYADGIRNDFDMVFASNGHLYAAINGSSAGGSVPGTPTDTSTIPVANRPDKDSHVDANGNYTFTSPASHSLQDVQQIEEDTLLDVKNGAYYGHPDPARGEYIIDAGHTGDATQDPYQFGAYPPGQQPDRSYTRPIYDFGKDYFPDGILQYQAVGNAAKALNGYLLVCRYSSGADILAMQPNSNGSIGDVESNVTGFTSLDAPLDIAEDKTNGNLYVTVLTGDTGPGSLMLLKPTVTAAGTATASLSRNKLGLYATPGDKNGDTGTVTITNTGTGDLVIDRSATKITGANRKNFVVSNLPTGDLTLAPNDSYTFDVKGVLAAGSTATAFGSLAIAVNDPSISSGYATVNLRVFDNAGNTASSTTPAALSTPWAVTNSLPSTAKSLIQQFGLDA